MASLDDLLIQLGLAPPMASPAPAPTAQPYTPYDTSVQPGTAFGVPYANALPVPTDTGAAPSGYTPQPRAALPDPLADPNSGMFDAYRNLYSPAPAEQDPLAALLGGGGNLPGMASQTPPSRALVPPWTGRQAGPQYGAQGGMQQGGLTHSERTLLDRNPTYARAIARIRSLDRMRAERGL